MGIFSLFGKKDRKPGKSAAGTTALREITVVTPMESAPKSALHEQQAHERRQAARATTLKIDAIESEMSSEFVRPQTNSLFPAQKSNAPLAPPAQARCQPSPLPGGPIADAVMPDTIFDSLKVSATLEDVPLFEEVAILFANGQARMAEQLLDAAIKAGNLGLANMTAWAMLLDLHQANGDQGAFEHLSIAYANQFETSPPAWMELPRVANECELPVAGITTVAFNDKLDADIVRLLMPLQALIGRTSAVRLEFQRITVIDPVGCDLLLHALTQLQASGIDLRLSGAPVLAARIRSSIKVGRRDETEAPWLLLLQLLALQNLEPAFEEASIDYCVTFEVSPPAFVAPTSSVRTMLPAERLVPGSELTTDLFVMPALVEGRTDDVLTALCAFVADNDPARIDCIALARIDVNAAGQLRARLAPLVADGRSVAFINVSHLVAALLGALGVKDIARVITRKN